MFTMSKSLNVELHSKYTVVDLENLTIGKGTLISYLLGSIMY